MANDGATLARTRWIWWRSGWLVVVVAAAVVLATWKPRRTTRSDATRAIELLRAGSLRPDRPGVYLSPRTSPLSRLVARSSLIAMASRGRPVFLQLRGLNHYTGWVYSEEPSTEDPLGNEPFQATDLGQNRY